MKKVQQTVEIELTKEECEILWKAENLLRDMKREIDNITTTKYKDDKEDISECLNSFGKITSRYNVHINRKVDGEIEF